MALYISLGPLSYLRDPSTVIEINGPGRIIELTTEQAAALPGLVAYWGSGSSYLAPQITMLSYDSRALFPLIGTPFHVYLDQSTGRLWQWDENTHVYTLVSIMSPLPPSEIEGATPTGTALITAANQAAAWATLGTVPTGNLPNLALIQFKGNKANQAAMLATTGEQGDWIIRADTTSTWVITASDPTLAGSWTELAFPVVTWSTISGKPAVIAAGADAAAARTAVGAGDASSNTSTSVDAEVALFAGTAGKTLRRASGTGLAKLTSGVLSTAAAGTDYVAPGGALGTPASGTLTSCTGLPVAGIAASTATALGVGSLELGHASDTTVSRVSAGVAAVEGFVISTKAVVPLTTTATLAAVVGREYIYLLGAGAVPTLPTAVGSASYYTLKNVSGGAITVATTSSQTIEGSTTYVLVDRESINLVSDNANWGQI